MKYYQKAAENDQTYFQHFLEKMKKISNLANWIKNLYFSYGVLYLVIKIVFTE